ncbi:UDP-N-acetylmuramoyl-tripeptide--D-alanyl-D-alanine ligase [Altererythrobacter aquiaggeris]|uniref:UDP-N-acetylmuramoyl-tripeptide--D-alanyl-D- alanine ligase n=1 Tax=Aestuarierythrobacter aquiaggeris TaxID=1898396 RepID=UPI003016FC4B
MASHPALLQWPRERGNRAKRALWDAAALADAMAGCASEEFQVSGVEIDSRDVRPGDLFFALKGDAMDGHVFLEKAFAAGAAAAVVDRPIPQPHILVGDTFLALEALASASRDRSAAKRIGVTGSVGKTGVKEALFAALDRSSSGQSHRSVKSYNNHVGVPLSLARMPAGSKYGIFEMGMNHAGEIADLTAQVRPDVAVIVTIAPAHIENLGSEEAIADAKAEIFGGLRPGGTAVIPADSPHFARLRDAARKLNAKVVSFGRSSDADVRLLDAIPSANGGSLVTAELGKHRLCYSVAEPGEHWIANSLAVIAAVRAVGGDLGAAGLSLAEMGGLKGRGARHKISAISGKALLIDESYNANPASMRATLQQLGQTPATRRVAVLGSMKELGDFADGFHSQLSEPVIAARTDFVVLVGDEMRALANALSRELGKGADHTLGIVPAFAHCASPGEAISALEEYGITSGDAILVKGSNSVGLGRLVDHFVNREG